MTPAGGRLGVLLAMLLLLPGMAGGDQGSGAGGPGSLVGRVRFVGAPPDPAVVTLRRDGCDEPARPGAPGPGPDGGLAGAVVWIEGVGHGKRGSDAVLDMEGCRFVPRVLAVAPGGRVTVRNSDAVVHNPQGVVGAATVFNAALPFRGQVVDVTRRLTGPGVVRVRCGLHPGMEGWIVVHDSPYVAVTDEAGRFRIADVPAGRYRVSLWHEGFAPRRAGAGSRPDRARPLTASRTVRIVPGADVALDLELRGRT